MKVVMFYHSLLSDWNHGNAHFLRGIVSEMLDRKIQVDVFEPENSWSYNNLISNYGDEVIAEFANYYPKLKSHRYNLNSLDLELVLDNADLVIVHEWNDHELVKKIGEHRNLQTGYRLLFHDTHHRSVTQPEEMAAYDLSNYDGVLAYGEVIKEIYLQKSWIQNAWTWHEAADVRLFHPVENIERTNDLVWIGNWGDEERTNEIKEFFVYPAAELKIKTKAYGVRYPDYAVNELNKAGIKYCGWLPNYKVPEVFATHKVTVHIPRKPYAEKLHGIPTIRPFEALACGIPLITSPWIDSENLFTPGKDFLVAENGFDMKRKINKIINEPDLAHKFSEQGRRTILEKHTCSHRVDELLDIFYSLKNNTKRKSLRLVEKNSSKSIHF